MDPGRRTLRRLTLQDASKAANLFSLLMGSQVCGSQHPRQAWCSCMPGTLHGSVYRMELCESRLPRAAARHLSAGLLEGAVKSMLGLRHRSLDVLVL